MSLTPSPFSLQIVMYNPFFSLIFMACFFNTRMFLNTEAQADDCTMLLFVCFQG